jgi:hypothetical protein
MERMVESGREASQAIVSELYRRLEKHAAHRMDKIRVKRGKDWIGWASMSRDRTFAELRAHRSRVEVFIRPPRRELRDPSRLAERAPSTQGWGWFLTRFSVSRPGQVRAASQLLMQSYEWTVAPGNGRSVPRRRTRNGQIV